MNNVTSAETSQVIAFPLSNSLAVAEKRQEDIRQLLDPTGERVLDSTLQLLETKSRVTIREVCAAVGIHYKACRNRLNLIVELKRLRYEPGAGSIPAHYSLPKGSLDGKVADSSLSYFDRLLNAIQNEKEAVSQQMAKLQSRLDELARDEEQAKAVMAMGEKYLGSQGESEGS